MSQGRLQVHEMTDLLTCVLCGGYLIDAATITECLHSFCKTCIVRYLEISNFCPMCDVLVHKTRPLLGLRPDRTLQDLVYKLVPGLFAEELKRRKMFYEAWPEHDPGGSLMSYPCEEDEQGSAGHGSPSSRCSDDSEDRFFTQDEQISVALEFSPNGRPHVDARRKAVTAHARSERSADGDAAAADDDEEEAERSILPVPPPPRYLLCPAVFTVKLLKKFLRDKFDLHHALTIDLFYAEESLRDDYSLIDIAYIYTWQRSGPLRLFYSVYQPRGWSPPALPAPITAGSFSDIDHHDDDLSSLPASSPSREDESSSPPMSPSSSSPCSSPQRPPAAKKRKLKTTRSWQSVHTVDERCVVREALRFTINPKQGVIRRSSVSSSCSSTETYTETRTETRTRTVRMRKKKFSSNLNRKLRSKLNSSREGDPDDLLLSESMAHLSLPVAPVTTDQTLTKKADELSRSTQAQTSRWEIRNFTFNNMSAGGTTNSGSSSPGGSLSFSPQASSPQGSTSSSPQIRALPTGLEISPVSGGGPSPQGQRHPGGNSTSSPTVTSKAVVLRQSTLDPHVVPWRRSLTFPADRNTTSNTSPSGQLCLPAPPTDDKSSIFSPTKSSPLDPTSMTRAIVPYRGNTPSTAFNPTDIKGAPGFPTSHLPFARPPMCTANATFGFLPQGAALRSAPAAQFYRQPPRGAGSSSWRQPWRRPTPYQATRLVN